MSVNNKKKTLETLFSQYGAKCHYCGEKLSIIGGTIDHLKAVNNGGTDDLINLRPSCYACNQIKANHNLQGFGRQVQAEIERIEPRLKKLKRIKKYLTDIVFWEES